ncbi:MAG TPA: DUF3105 domain-containing protein [Gaiellaceae bacterium]|nr:DUF3105 domain-containing protein [Gaiellaceae bacterium]
MDADRQKKLLYGLALAGLLGLAIAVIVIFATGGSTKDVKEGSDATVQAAMTAAGCTFVTKPVLPPVHKVSSGFHVDVPTLTTKVKWSTFPPSGGAHYSLWAVWGFYTQPVNPRQVVHNEEHGGVIMWWGPKVPQAEIAKMRDFYFESPNGMFGTPIAGLGDKIALTAWTGDPPRYYQNGYYGIGHLAVCPRFDEKAFTVFRDTYRGHGPEGVPLSADVQGSGPQS